MSPQVEDQPTYTMSVDLSVLESLGINLYSNAAAVLSELVANAYDADASEVAIDWKQQDDRIIVADDGCGMTIPQINERFLTAGYKKRKIEGTASPRFARPFMGRKGIGKLAVFSIARTVNVYTSPEPGVWNGLRIRVRDLEARMEERKAYHPARVDVPVEYQRAGTTLILDDLKTKRADLTATALRKRLARRFDVLDSRSADEGGFRIIINGSPLSWADRQELKRLEFIWEFGKKSLPDAVLPPNVTRIVLPSSAVDAGRGWHVGGWFGTAKKPTDLTSDDDAGSLKNIIVLARGRPIQEGIIEKLDFSRLFGNYVTGQVTADFLDLDGDEFEDIATSDRQRLIEDDVRVIGLQKFLRGAFVTAADQWSDARPKKEAIDVLANFPQLREWVDSRPGWQRPSAERMIGTIASLELEAKNEKEDRKALFRSGVLGFERIGLRNASDALEQLSNVTAIDLLPLLGAQDAYESALWVDILRSRIQAIDQLRHLSKVDEKEKVLQKHLFDHLWLLDASWERATTGGRMEEDLRSLEPGLFARDAEGRKLHGRMDIRYATLSGRHVIVELKRYSVKVDVRKLVEQGTKYVNALKSILEQQQRDDEVPGIEVIFVLGSRPGAAGVGISRSVEDYYRTAFTPINGSFVLYDALIEQARNQYHEYLEATDKSRALDELLGTLEPETTQPQDLPTEETGSPGVQA